MAAEARNSSNTIAILTQQEIEQEDNNSRPEFAGQLPDLTKYDRLLIGHPTWWGIPPRIINTVIEKLDLSGKEIATFSTSGGIPLCSCG